jgi:hypothetical protein
MPFRSTSRTVGRAGVDPGRDVGEAVVESFSVAPTSGSKLRLVSDDRAHASQNRSARTRESARAVARESSAIGGGCSSRWGARPAGVGGIPAPLAAGSSRGRGLETRLTCLLVRWSADLWCWLWFWCLGGWLLACTWLHLLFFVVVAWLAVSPWEIGGFGFSRIQKMDRANKMFDSRNFSLVLSKFRHWQLGFLFLA